MPDGTRPDLITMTFTSECALLTLFAIESAVTMSKMEDEAAGGDPALQARTRTYQALAGALHRGIVSHNANIGPVI